MAGARNGLFTTNEGLATMTRDRDHFDREGGPGEVKGSKSSGGKVMTREEMDALETDFSHWEVSSYSALLKLLLRLIATVRDREAEIERLRSIFKSDIDTSEAYTSELIALQERAEQAEAERDRLHNGISQLRTKHAMDCLTWKNPQARCTCLFEDLQALLTPTENADA